MKLKTILEKLCCPFDKENLDLKTIRKDLDDNIIEGILTCRHCRRIYPIVSGIPIMSPDEYRNFELEKPLLARWSQHIDIAKIEQFKLLQ